MKKEKTKHYKEDNQQLNPKFAIIDHFKNVSHSSALNRYKTLNDAVNDFIEIYGIEQMYEFIAENDINQLFENKLNNIINDIKILDKI